VTSGTQFRSNGFQTMAIDGTGRVYLAWPDRGYATTRSDPQTGDSRIVLSTSTTGATWTVPKAIQAGGIGHQLMPAMTFHGGKLRVLYYDLREDVAQIFGPGVDDARLGSCGTRWMCRWRRRRRAVRRCSPRRGSRSMPAGS
jgi:hypothetical protein